MSKQVKILSTSSATALSQYDQIKLAPMVSDSLGVKTSRPTCASDEPLMNIWGGGGGGEKNLHTSHSSIKLLHIFLCW